MARLMGYSGQQLRDIFHAGALHDIGLVRAEHRLRVASTNDLEGLLWHGELGYELLRDNEFFARAAPIIRDHHVVWDHGRGAETNGRPIPQACFILALADYLDRNTQPEIPILDQCDHITQCIVDRSGTIFHPDCVDAFLTASRSKSFWLDLTSKRIYAILNTEIDWPIMRVDEDAIVGIAHVFARVADGLNPWTATHSAGVATTALAIAERMNFSPHEMKLMRAAGYLHDLGKVSVPGKILDKRGRPTASEWAVVHGHTYYTFHILNAIGGMPQIREWAAFHHERLDGTGYPFGHAAKDLTLGARIMAIADITTALLENRPYRKSMPNREATNILNKLVANGGLDGDIVHILLKDFETITAMGQEEEANYAVKQRTLLNVMNNFAEPVCV